MWNWKQICSDGKPKRKSCAAPLGATSIFCLDLSSNWLSSLAVISHPRCSLWSQETCSTFTPWMCSRVSLKNKCMHLKHTACLYPSFSRTFSFINTLKTSSKWDLTQKILQFSDVLFPCTSSLPCVNRLICCCCCCCWSYSNQPFMSCCASHL